jgi:hypothetical protein
MAIDSKRPFLSRFFGSEESVDEPNPLFDSEYYLSHYQGVNPANAYKHYCKFGIAKGFNPNEFFDTRWYLSVYPDVDEEAMNPLDHYLKFGSAEGRNPSPRFSSLLYLAVYPDVARQLINPLLHYMTVGKSERRQPIPVSILPPSKRVVEFFSEDLAAFAAGLRIDGLIGHLVRWEDKFWVWTSLTRNLSALPDSDLAMLHPPEADLVSLQYEPARAGDFRPSFAAIQLLKEGLTLFFAKQKELRELNADSESTVVTEREEVFSDQTVAYDNIGEEVSARFWREFIFMVNTLSAEVREPISISDNENFSFALLSKLEAIFPLPLSTRALFFYILHNDLRVFVEQNKIIEGAWGSLTTHSRQLILSIRPPSQEIRLRLRPRRRSVAI